VNLRVRYCKIGKVRFVSHRDGARLWERALRRVALPVAYTEGFTPRPKLGFGLALPTGAESVAEYIDIDLVKGAEVDPGDSALIDAMSAALPVGLDVALIVERDPSANSLQEDVTSTTWELSGACIESEDLETAARRLLDADQVLVDRVRKGRSNIDDVRPLIRAFDADPTGTKLVAELVTIGRALRPSELASAALPGIDALGIRVLRTHQWIEHDGDKREVLPLPVATAHARESSA